MRHIPNILTIARFVLVPCFIAASFAAMYATAFAIFVTAAVTDVLDGMLARRWNVRSRIGAFLDPAADKTLMVSGFLYYTLSPDLPVIGIPAWLTFTVFIRDVLITFFVYLMWTRIQLTRFPPSIAGKLSTVLQAVTLAAAIGGNAFSPVLAQLASVLFRVSLVVTLYSGWDYMRRAARVVAEAPSRQA